MAGPPQLPVWAFFVIACGVTLLLTMAETLASFPYNAPFIRILRSGWALLLDAVFVLLTLAIGMILWEMEILEISWAWAFGLGFGVPWAMKTGVVLFQPLAGNRAEITASLKKAVDRLRGYCYLRISQQVIPQARIDFRKQLRDQPLSTLKERFEVVCPPEELEQRTKMYEEWRKESEESAKRYLISTILKFDPSYPDEVTPPKQTA